MCGFRPLRLPRAWCCGAAIAALSLTTLGLLLGVVLNDPGANVPETAVPLEPSLARSVLSPTQARLSDLDSSCAAEAAERLRPPIEASLSGLLHGLHLWGRDLTVQLPDGDRTDAVSVLLNSGVAEQFFRGAAPLAPTQHGLRVPLFAATLLGTDQPSAEGHRGQLLSVLAALDIPLTHPVRVAGQDYTVRDILNDTLANMQLSEHELAWYTTAIALYMPTQPWQDKWGRTYCLDDLASELVQRTPEGASCAGAQDLIALTIILRVDDLQHPLERGVRQRVTHRLQVAVAQLARSQYSDGSWRLDWHQSGERGGATAAISDLRSHDALLATGHHLEWLLLLPESLAVEPKVVEQAAVWLMRAIAVQTAEPELVWQRYCPLIHGVRSLQMLASDAHDFSCI